LFAITLSMKGSSGDDAPAFTCEGTAQTYHGFQPSVPAEREIGAVINKKAAGAMPQRLEFEV